MQKARRGGGNTNPTSGQGAGMQKHSEAKEVGGFGKDWAYMAVGIQREQTGATESPAKSSSLISTERTKEVRRGNQRGRAA